MSHEHTDGPFPGEAEMKALARTLTVADGRLETPPPGLFAGIEARIAADERRQAARDTMGGEQAAGREQAAGGPAGATRPRWMRVAPFLAAAAAVAVLFVGMVAVNRSDDSSAAALGEVALTNAGLDPAGADSSAVATLVELADGSLALDIDVGSTPPAGDGFLELWIIDTQVQGMYSLGPLHGTGRYPLPAHVDPSQFPVVDISVEPTDGEPTHSGVSVLRGLLDLDA